VKTTNFHYYHQPQLCLIDKPYIPIQGTFLKLKQLEDAKEHIVAYAEGRENLSRKSSILDKGAELMQSFKPIDQIHQHLCGFQFYAHGEYIA